MTGETLVTALAIFLVVEGLLPLLAPSAWREAFQRMLQFSDGQLRFIGLLAVAAGAVLLAV